MIRLIFWLRVVSVFNATLTLATQSIVLLSTSFQSVLYTRYHSKCRHSVGIKVTLGKVNNLSIVILWFGYLTQYKVTLNPSKKGLSNITTSLHLFVRTLHGCTLFDNAGAIILNNHYYKGVP